MVVVVVVMMMIVRVFKHLFHTFYTLINFLIDRVIQN